MMPTVADLDHHTALALLLWQQELGADEAIGDDPVNRYEMAAVAQVIAQAVAQVPQAVVPAPQAKADPVQEASIAAASAATLADLAEALQAFDGCELKLGARNFVFADGNPLARVMIIGEAPGREEDQEGRPFVGPAGQLLDRMFAAIGLSRTAQSAEDAIYITNVLPWRPPQNRDPDMGEIAMMLPFLTRHIELADPDLIVLMGNTPCQAMLEKRGILRLRGTWAEVLARPAMPMAHPAYLLRTPEAKREAWADLLSIQAKLKDMT